MQHRADSRVEKSDFPGTKSEVPTQRQRELGQRVVEALGQRRRVLPRHRDPQWHPPLRRGVPKGIVRHNAGSEAVGLPLEELSAAERRGEEKVQRVSGLEGVRDKGCSKSPFFAASTPSTRSGTHLARFPARSSVAKNRGDLALPTSLPPHSRVRAEGRGSCSD